MTGAGWAGTLLSVAVLVAFALIGRGIWMLWRRQGKPLNAWLMLGAAVVLLVNVWVGSMPIPG